MTTTELLDRAEALAKDLLTYAEETGVSGTELIAIVTVTGRLLHHVCFPGEPRKALETVMEANATFDAVASSLEGN